MAVLRVNNVGDVVGTTNPITLASAGATSVTWSSAPVNMPAVSSPDILKIVVEPNKTTEEIIYVTAYTPGATSATVVRAQEGSTALVHAATAWAHAPTAADYNFAFVGTAAPSSSQYTLWMDTSTTTGGPVFPGMILNRVFYSVSTLAQYQLTSSPAALDSSHLTISYVAPASGAVYLSGRLYGRIIAPNSVTEVWIYIGFVTHGTNTVVGYLDRVLDVSTLFVNAQGWLSGTIDASIFISGLTPGTTYQVDLAACYAGTPSQATLYAGDGAGTTVPPVTLKVIAA